MLNKFVISMLCAFLGFALSIPSADAVQRGDEQQDARAQMMAGKVKSLRSIENRVLPKMAGSQYLGPEFDPIAQIYRLKFIRKGRVIFVDVDGRSGAIIRQRR